MNFRTYGMGEEENSVIRNLLSESVEALGGYSANVFKIKDKAEKFQNLHNLLGDDKLDMRKCQEKCVHVDKIQKVTVGEKSSVRDLNLAVLMTHPDYIGPVYFFRGQALMTAKRWHQAIQDFGLAVEYKYDSNAVYKIHHKIGQCYIKRKEYTKAVKSFQTALNSVKSAKIGEKAREEFAAILSDCIKKFSAKKDEKRKTVEGFAAYQPNKIDPRITDQVEVMETIGKGRNAYAKSTIQVGTILAVVDGLGTHLNPDDPNKVMQFCLHCMKGLEVPYPCNTCPRVVFCSPECKSIAEESYHKYQCQLDLYNVRLNDSKDGCTIFQSLVVLASKPASFWVGNQNAFLEPSSDSDWPIPVNTDTEQFSLLFQMTTNEDEVDKETHARHAIVTLLLLRALRKTTYYEDSGLKMPTGNLTPEEMVIGKLIYKLRLIQDMNSHPIWGVSASTKDQNIGKEHLGGGMYTGIGSYFNSDCNPNTIRVNIGTKMLLIASKNIRKGEEVMDNYCIHFSELPTQTRKPWIRDHFLFDCECEACSHDWPTYRQLPQERPNAKIAEKLVTLEMENITAMENGNIEKALGALNKEITLIQGSLSEPHQLSVTIRTTLQFCWWKKIILYLQKVKEVA